MKHHVSHLLAGSDERNRLRKVNNLADLLHRECENVASHFVRQPFLAGHVPGHKLQRRRGLHPYAALVDDRDDLAYERDYLGGVKGPRRTSVDDTDAKNLGSQSEQSGEGGGRRG